MSGDPFDDVLHLEDQYYDQGYKQGYEDGFQAGKIEGRSVGLKKGFEKFVEAGRLQGKAVVWANRLQHSKQQVLQMSNSYADSPAPASQSKMLKLPLLGGNPRLEKNITSLYALVEPGTLSTKNSDEAVNDFDDRLKRAEGKLKIVERFVKEGNEKEETNEAPRPVRNEI